MTNFNRGVNRDFDDTELKEDVSSKPAGDVVRVELDDGISAFRPTLAMKDDGLEGERGLGPLLSQHLVFPPGSGGLTADECDAVRNLAANHEQLARPALLAGAHYRPDYRRSSVAWLELTTNTQWLFRRAFSLAYAANIIGGWNFDIKGPAERLQLTTYLDSERGMFDWHLDLGPGYASTRKITVVIEVTTPARGGFLQFSPGPNPRSVIARTGSGVAFPSYLPHRLTQVTAGRRLSVVAWVCGPQFR